MRSAMNFFGINCLLGLLGLVLTASALSAADWPRWRGPNGDGISTETGWQAKFPGAGPGQLWRQSVGTGFGSVSVSDGRIYTMGNENDHDTVFCFDAATGEEIWKHTYAMPLEAKNYEGGPNTTPTVNDGRVYTLSRGGHLFCFDAAKGTVIWSKNLVDELNVTLPTWGFASSPLVEGDLLILNVGVAGTAVDKRTGKIVWTTGGEPSGYATPVPLDWRGERHVLVFGGKALHLVNASNGARLWQHEWITDWDVNAADPIVYGNQVFVSSGYNHGGALLDISGPSPEVVWKNRNMRNQMSPSVLLSGFIYGFDGNHGRTATLRCLDFNTGEPRWTEPIGYGTLSVADGKLIALSERGELFVAEATPEGFNPISRAHIMGGKCWTVPVLSHGRLYTRNAQGDLVCFDLRAP
jgi:outer membrane protein assembly factor BamB